MSETSRREGTDISKLERVVDSGRRGTRPHGALELQMDGGDCKGRDMFDVVLDGPTSTLSSLRVGTFNDGNTIFNLAFQDSAAIMAVLA